MNSAPNLPGFFTTAALLFRLHLANSLRSRRFLVCATLAIIPPGLSALMVRFGPEQDAPETFFTAITLWFSFQLVVPLIALVAGSAVVTEEVENRTITYLFSRPVHRSAVLLGRWLACALWVAVLVAGSSAAVGLVCAYEDRAVEGLAFYLPSVQAAAIGGALYSLVFTVLGVFLRRPMVVGLGYVFAVEGLVANLPGSSQNLALQFHLRSIAVDPSHSFWTSVGPPGMFSLRPPVEAAGTLAILALFVIALGVFGISRRQFVLPA